MKTKILPFLLAASGAFAADATVGVWLQPETINGHDAQLGLSPEAAEVLAQNFWTFHETEAERAFILEVERSERNPRTTPEEALEYSAFLNLVARQYALWLHQRHFDHLSYWQDHLRGFWTVNGISPTYFLASLGVDLNGGRHADVLPEVVRYEWDEAAQEWEPVRLKDEDGEPAYDLYGFPLYEYFDAPVEWFAWPLGGRSYPRHMREANGDFIIHGGDGTQGGRDLDNFLYDRDPRHGNGVGVPSLFAGRGGDILAEANRHTHYGVGHIPGGERIVRYRREDDRLPDLFADYDRAAAEDDAAGRYTAALALRRAGWYPEGVDPADYSPSKHIHEAHTGEWVFRLDDQEYVENGVYDGGGRYTVTRRWHEGTEGIFVLLTLNTFVNPDEDFWNAEMFRTVTRAREPYTTAQQFEHYRRFPWPEAEVLAGTRQRGQLYSEWFGHFETHGHEAAPWVRHEQLGWLWTRADEFGTGVEDPPWFHADAPGQVTIWNEPGIRTEPGFGDGADDFVEPAENGIRPVAVWRTWRRLDPEHPRYGKASGPGRIYEFFWTGNYDRDYPNAVYPAGWEGALLNARVGAHTLTFKESTESAGLWAWHPALGMFRTAPDLWPWLYAADEGRWLYFGWGDTRNFFLYDPAQGAWVQVEG